MKYVALLLSESPELSKAEFLANLEKQGVKAKTIASDLPILVVDCDKKAKFDDLALTYEVSEYFGRKVTDIDLKTLKKQVAVRAKKIPKSVDKPSTEMERAVGGHLTRAGFSINFKAPKDTVRIYLTQKSQYYGRKVFESDRKQFEERKDKNRPFQSPVSLHPRIARALVNLARVKKGDKILDPFVGTGGILIEAGLMGANVNGIDLKHWMVEGSKKNLKHYKVRHYVGQGDALTLGDKFKGFDAVITDPPYGRNTTKEGLDKLYKDFMAAAPKYIRKDGYLVLSSHKERLPKSPSMKLIETHTLYIHKTLTKKIFVYRKV